MVIMPATSHLSRTGVIAGEELQQRFSSTHIGYVIIGQRA
jgi:hypothetical protein